MAIQHKNVSDAERHEPKGASTATINHVLSSDGDTTTSFRAPMMMGWYNYDHDGASVAITAAATYYDLINDGAGPNTYSFQKLPGVDDVWNTSTNRFDFTDLEVGDTLDIRVDLVVTTGASNTGVDLVLELATGSGSPITIPIFTRNFKVAATYQITTTFGTFLGSALTQGNPARLRVRADATGSTVVINGWYVRVIKPGDTL